MFFNGLIFFAISFFIGLCIIIVSIKIFFNNKLEAPDPPPIKLMSFGYFFLLIGFLGAIVFLFLRFVLGVV